MNIQPWPPDKYVTHAEVDGVKYEIVKIGLDMFGEQMFQACTFGIEMVPTPVRRVLGTYSNRTEAVARLVEAMPPKAAP